MNSIPYKIISLMISYLAVGVAFAGDWQGLQGPGASLSNYTTEATKVTTGTLSGKDFYSVTIYGDTIDTTTGWWGDEDIYCTKTRMGAAEVFSCE